MHMVAVPQDGALALLSLTCLIMCGCGVGVVWGAVDTTWRLDHMASCVLDHMPATLGQRRGGFQKLVAQQVAHGGVEMMDHVTVTGVLLERAVGGLSPLRAVGVEVGIVHGPTGIVTARQRLLVGLCLPVPSLHYVAAFVLLCGCLW